MKIQPRKVTAIVGGSGVGKSTLMKLLMRLYEPTKGVITVDGIPLRECDWNYCRKCVAVVNQVPLLFNQSVLENIAYGLNEDPVTMDEDEMLAQVTEAAEAANVHEFLEKKRAGYDANAGESGNALSGGQKQRVAIARAIIRKSKVLILDEATSALDAKNEKLVQIGLGRLTKNKTTIVIAHRLSTIKLADEIFCLEDGAVAEHGTHEILMDNDGPYARLVKEQLVKEREKVTKSKVEDRISELEFENARLRARLAKLST